MYDDFMSEEPEEKKESSWTKPQEEKKAGGWNNNNKFVKKEEVIEEPYRPVTVFIEKSTPKEIQDNFYALISKLISKGITVRVNGDIKEFCDRVSALSSSKVEVYIPWKAFNDINSKHYYNTLTSKELAKTNFMAWDKVPDVVKAILARNIRMIFGDKNNSVSMCVITWSTDGASRHTEVTKDTGNAAFVIKTASMYGFPIVNIGKAGYENILSKAFDI